MAITFKDIEKANGTIKTTNIKGKQYAEVNQRIKAFRMLYPEGFIRTKIVSHENGLVVMKAEAGYTDETGTDRILGSGLAFEERGKGMINGTSYIENCETSAVGRALGMLALGVDVSVASYEEVSNAIAQQNQPKKAAPKTAPAEKQYKCQVCGQVVTDYGSMKASGIAKKSYQDYGQVMCYNCAHAEKEKREQASANVDVAQIAEDAAMALPFPIDDM